MPAALLPNLSPSRAGHFFARTSRGLGAIALASLLPRSGFALNEAKSIGGLAGLPHFAPKAKRIIYLFQSGAPSQMDLFDYKPLLNKLNGQQLPDARPRRPAADRHDGAAGVHPAGRLGFRIQTAWPVRHVVQRIAAAHRRSWRTSSA